MENYTVGKPIGRGHFSIVYKAKDNRTRQLVALKRISMFELTDETRQKTLQEVDILTHLDHPNIIRCFESFLHDQDLIIVTEYAEMGDLSGMIKKQYETAQPLDESSIWYAPAPCLLRSAGCCEVRRHGVFDVTAISLPYVSLFLSCVCARVFVPVSLCVCACLSCVLTSHTPSLYAQETIPSDSECGAAHAPQANHAPRYQTFQHSADSGGRGEGR